MYNKKIKINFQVASPIVRGNAALLLIDVFPLNDSELGIQEADNLIQKQFDIFLVRILIYCLSFP